jgi:hypothetical protein
MDHPILVDLNFLVATKSWQFVYYSGIQLLAVGSLHEWIQVHSRHHFLESFFNELLWEKHMSSLDLQHSLVTFLAMGATLDFPQISPIFFYVIPRKERSMLCFTYLYLQEFNVHTEHDDIRFACQM